MFTFPILLSAQIKQTYQGVRAGDKIIKQQISWVDPGKSGKDVTWDFSRVKPEGQEYVVEYEEPTIYVDSLFPDGVYILGLDTFPASDIRPGELVIGLEHYTAYYYRIRNNRMVMLGFENPVNLMHYSRPRLEMSYALNPGVKESEPYESEVIYSSCYPLVTRGEIGLETDAFGKLILPSKDTLEHAVRVRSVQTIRDDARKRKSTVEAISTDTETFRWYVSGYRYPVFEVTRMLNTLQKTKSETIFQTAFYYPPESHFYLEEDPDNLMVLEQQEFIRSKGDGGEVIEESGNNRAITGTGWGCNFYPNPVVTDLYIEYETMKNTDVSISLFDSSGRIQQMIPKRQVERGRYEERLDCSSLTQGVYILKLYFGEEETSRVVVKI